MDKQVQNLADTLSQHVFDGMTLAVGGFGLCGIPEQSILALLELGVKDLTVISNNCGVDDWGLGLLLKNRQIRKMISSYVGENKEFAHQVMTGQVEVELVPQGTLAERIRAGGAGIPAFYTATGFGTQAAEGKETRVFNGKNYVMETALLADLAVVRAFEGDRFGNLLYRKTARNFNPVVATCGKKCLAEVEKIVEVGQLDPDHVHTPGIYVDYVYEAQQEKRIEQLTLRD